MKFVKKLWRLVIPRTKLEDKSNPPIENPCPSPLPYVPKHPTRIMFMVTIWELDLSEVPLRKVVGYSSSMSIINKVIEYCSRTQLSAVTSHTPHVITTTSIAKANNSIHIFDFKNGTDHIISLK